MTSVSDDARTALAIENVCYAYDDQKNTLRDVNLEIVRGEIVALLGPSGCGKTTLLHLIAGLLRPSSGIVRIGGKLAADGKKNVFLPPERRGLGMVFQDYALWPHMNIGRNVAFPLEMQGIRKAERSARVSEALARVGLEAFEKRLPSQLSGGQQQRAAIARAIVAEPSVVLFDEPLSNLDRELREGLAQDLSVLIRQVGLTAVYVTHDQTEAFLLADRIALMRHGEIIQSGSPQELVERPETPETAAFLNLGALAHADRDQAGWRLRGTRFRFSPDVFGGPAMSVQVLIPRRAVSFAESDGAHLDGTIVRMILRPEGFVSQVRLDQNGPEIVMTAPLGKSVMPGDRVGVAIDAASLRWFPSSASS